MPVPQVALLLALVQGQAEGPLYRIVARLDEGLGTLSARAQVVVRNATGEPLTVLRLAAPSSIDIHRVAVAGVPIRHTVSAGGGLEIALSRPLVPRDSLTVELDWTARPRHRHGREYAFTSWQPRFPGFGAVLLRLDVPLDQVVSASGVALCGDPGWAAARRPAGGKVTWQRTWYPGSAVAAAARSACDSGGAGRKIVVWYAERVAGLALALSPDFRYEEGDFLERPMRVFYLPGDAPAWGAGAAVAHGETALAWLHEIFGPYPWPQATVVRTPESADTALPMQVWSGNADQLQLLRGLGRMYTGGLVSVRDPSDAWLDEGLARFQATWYLEAVGLHNQTAQLEREVLAWDLDGVSQPIARPRSAFRDSGTASAMVSRRGELFLHQLRAIVGDSVLRAALRRYFDGHRFREVHEASFRESIEQVFGHSLSGVFDQWLRGTALIDYRVGGVKPEHEGTGWRTEVRVDAHGPARFPVAVWVITESDTGVAQIEGEQARENVVVVTKDRPRRVLIDPEGRSHDWNVLNNQRTLGLQLGRDRPSDHYLDTYFSRRSRRDRVTIGWAPLLWPSDRDRWTFALRRREDYLGRFELNETLLGVRTGRGGRTTDVAPQASIELRNPVRLRATGWGQRLGVRWLDGRVGATIGVEWSRRRSVTGPANSALGLSLEWLTVRTRADVDSLFYDDAGTVELTLAARWKSGAARWRTRLVGALSGGFQYSNDRGRAIRDEPYGHLTAMATLRSDAAARFGLAMRVFGGVTVSRGALVRQRLIYLAGADPYARMASPFLRSPGSLLARNDLGYHAPGGAGVRGLDPRRAAPQAYGFSVEAEGRLWRRRGGIARRASLAFFADAALANGGLTVAARNPLTSVADAGAGIRIDHRVGATSFQTRLDVPVWISRPTLAQDRAPGGRAVGWRWTFSFSPAF